MWSIGYIYDENYRISIKTTDLRTSNIKNILLQNTIS